MPAAAIDENVIAGLRLAGATQEVIDRLIEERGGVEQETAEQVCEVWDENWESLMEFRRMRTQWVHASPGGLGGGLVRIGLHYPGVESALRMRRVPRARMPALFDDLHLMENAVVDGDAEARAKQAAEHAAQAPRRRV